MPSYRVKIIVREIRGDCALGLNPGDEFTVEKFYIPQTKKDAKICLHALIGISTLLLPFLKGVPAHELGIGEGDVGYVQCPDPGKPYTSGGTVIFELRRERID